MTLKEGKIINDRYELKRQLGQGSFGNVWLAYNILAEIDVAIKFYGAFDDKGIEEFRNEFKVAYKLHHPNLLSINQLDVFENCPYLVMPYCANGSVNSQIGKFSEIEIWKFILDVSCGLSFLHEQQPHIIHQDIKPDNILITDEGRYVISDFGISRSFRSKLSRTQNNMNSSGTIPYMGPERFSEKPLVVLASDIWAFGMTIYELITGDVLWEGMGGCAQLNGARIPSIDNITPELAQLIFACLSKKTWHRPTAAQIYEYAQAYLKNEPLPVLKNITSNTQSAEKPIITPHTYQPQVNQDYPLPDFQQQLSQKDAVNPNMDNQKNWFKRIAIIAATCLAGIIIVSSIFLYNYVHEQLDFLSCRTKEDFEQFIKKYPLSEHCATAKKSIAAMTLKGEQKEIKHTAESEAKEMVKAKESQIQDIQNSNHKQLINKQKTSLKVKPNSTDIIEMTPNDAPPTANHVVGDDQLFYGCQTRTDFENYLKKYPNGKHRADALRAIDNNTNTQGDIVNSNSPTATKAHSAELPKNNRDNGKNSTTSINIGIDVGRLLNGGQRHGHPQKRNDGTQKRPNR